MSVDNHCRYISQVTGSLFVPVCAGAHVRRCRACGVWRVSELTVETAHQYEDVLYHLTRACANGRERAGRRRSMRRARRPCRRTAGGLREHAAKTRRDTGELPEGRVRGNSVERVAIVTHTTCRMSSSCASTRLRPRSPHSRAPASGSCGTWRLSCAGSPRS